ncbi:MAG: hypothetical protein R3261_15360 [Alphaproteobacteria bacterium]|nr:hypothetical protein [Alphaproteobacteria bacterium]
MKLRQIGVLLIVIAATAACGFQGPYVGKHVEDYHPLLCTCDSLPASCSTNDDLFNFNYTISKGENEKEYIIEGFVDGFGREGEQWDELEGYFFLLLASEGDAYGYKKIFQQVNVLPRARDLSVKIPFKRAFTCEEDFDAVVFSYNITVIYR